MVVYQRDRWDETLESLAQSLDVRLSWIVLLAQLAVTISRGILWALMHIGLLVSGLWLRQMEFDADRYEAKFAGSETFAETMRKMRVLGLSSELAHAQMAEQLGDRRLVENLPALILLNAREMPMSVAIQLEAAAAKSTTGWFDSHPSDRDRSRAAKRLDAEGVFRLDCPAQDLFANFAEQAAATTWDLYLGTFGHKVPRKALVPTAEFRRASKAQWTA